MQKEGIPTVPEALGLVAVVAQVTGPVLPKVGRLHQPLPTSP